MSRISAGGIKLATRDEIENLKDDWQRDPSYHLEDAIGFEDHRDELRAWRLVFEADYERMEEEQLRQRALAFGRSIERQQAIENAESEERKRRRSAGLKLEELFYAAGLRWFGPGPENLADVVDAIVDDLVRASEARVKATGLSGLHQ
jgi:hypothetical protein